MEIKLEEREISEDLAYLVLNGKHTDGESFYGALVKVKQEIYSKWKFGIDYSNVRKRPAGQYAAQFCRRNKVESLLAWNGGWELNLQMLAQNDLTDVYHGFFTGLFIAEHAVKGVPLFGHQALLIDKEGQISIKKVDMSEGINISCNTKDITIPKENRNLGLECDSLPEFCYYDANYQSDYIPGDGRVVVRFAGNTIKAIINTRTGKHVKHKPVGLTLSIEEEAFPPTWDMKEKDLNLKVFGLEEYTYGFELGPSLNLRDGTGEFEMNSNWSVWGDPAGPEIRDSRMVVGYGPAQELLICTFIERLDQSAGVSLSELASLLKTLGFDSAHCINPGMGSSLFQGKHRIEIQSDDKDANFQSFLKEAQPGTVPNAVFAYKK